jgi:hypothetical protein
MKRSGLILAITILLSANAIALILAARNRTGVPVQTIELTERELVLQSMGQDNSGVGLSLSWHRQEESAYFTRAQMEAIGFDFRIPKGREGKEMLLLPRLAYAALEYKGKAWEQWSQRSETEKQPSRPGPPSRSSTTRLFVVDLSPNIIELRSRYPDQSKYLIVAAVVQARFQEIKDPKTGTVIPDQCVGYISDILPSGINVPLPFSKLLAPLSPDPKAEPRYTVTLAYGRNLEPWVTSVKLK